MKFVDTVNFNSSLSSDEIKEINNVIKEKQYGLGESKRYEYVFTLTPIIAMIIGIISVPEILIACYIVSLIVVVIGLYVYPKNKIIKLEFLFLLILTFFWIQLINTIDGLLDAFE